MSLTFFRRIGRIGGKISHMAIAIDAADELALEYRRRARRLRGVYGAQPARLQRSLRDLARRHDLRRLIEKRSVRDPSADFFPLLRYSGGGLGWGLCGTTVFREMPPP